MTSTGEYGHPRAGPALLAVARELAARAGAVTEREGRAWLDAFREQGAHGPIVAGRRHIFVWGRKPA